MKTTSATFHAILRTLRAGRENKRAVRRIFLDSADDSNFPAVRAHELLLATWRYLKASRTFLRAGLRPALLELGEVNAGKRGRRGSDPSAVFWARDANWRVRALARTFGGHQLCLADSIGACAALRSLGFSVTVVIGYPVLERGDGVEELHAWPAIGSEPVTDRRSANPAHFVEVLRFPDVAKSERASREVEATCRH